MWQNCKLQATLEESKSATNHFNWFNWFMWIIEHGKLVSLKKNELTYIRKDQLIALDTQGICQSIAIFCPNTVLVSNLFWKKFQTIDTKDWVLTIIKLNGVAKTLPRPIIFADITTVEELYYFIINGDRQVIRDTTTTSSNI